MPDASCAKGHHGGGEGKMPRVALTGGSGRLLPERPVKQGLETLTTKFT